MSRAAVSNLEPDFDEAHVVREWSANMDILGIEGWTLGPQAQVAESAIDDDWIDVRISDHDLALVEWLLSAIARDDLDQVKQVIAILRRSNLPPHALNFLDTDSEQARSMVSVAISLGANQVADYLISRGLRGDLAAAGLTDD